jgi:uncharacterized protein
MVLSMSELAPVAPRERMVSLDVLRGFALCGVMIGNMIAYNWSMGAGAAGAPSGTLDHIAQWFLIIAVHSKAQTTLCLLFGLGFAMQLIRAEERGEPVTGLYLRRLAALLGFGLLHITALWWGDVTWTYAIAGLGLFPFVRVSNRARVIWALGFVFVPRLIASIPAVADATLRAVIEPAAQQAGTARFVAALHAPDHAGLWWEHLRFVLVFMTRIYPWYFLWVLGLFVLGYVAGVRRWFERDGADHLPVFRRCARWGGAFAVVTNAIAAAASLGWIPLGEAGLWGRLVALAAHEISLLATALAYVGIIVLLIQRPRWRRVLAVIAPAGRMPLTTYFTQSVVCTFLFYGWGLGWAGTVDIAGSIGIALVIFSAQIVVANLWLRRFRFGPFEWLWRAAVYWKLPAMR